MFGIDDAALAIILSGLVSTAGSLYTNKKNRDAQADANAVNWEIARQNNATQIEMANTAHQREVRDLRAAGLNPILSAGGNGSSSPTLSAASINPVHTDNAFEGLANSARGLSRYFGQQYDAQMRTMQAQADQAEADSDTAKMENAVLSRQVPLENVTAENDYLKAQLENDALRSMTHIGRWVPSEHGRVYKEVWSPRKDVRDWVQQGIESDLKIRSNANWRNNLSSFTPFVSPASLNSAGAAAQRFRYLWRTK